MALLTEVDQPCLIAASCNCAFYLRPPYQNACTPTRNSQVRKEMALLTEVDQPGSAIDRYVEKLDGILKLKMDGILELKVGAHAV